MFIECPFCQTKLSVDPAGIPEMGREKRCVNCFNRFRVVRTPDEVVLQFQESGGSQGTVDAGRSESSIQGHLSGLSATAVAEKRYAIPKEGDSSPDGFDAGGGSGVFADFFEVGEAPPDEGEQTAESPAPDMEMEVPAEQNLQLDEVFGQLSGDDSFSPRDADSAPRQPRLLNSQDLMDRKAKDYKRKYRLDAGAGSAPSSGTSLRDLADRVISNLTAFDALLIVVFLIVVIGACMGFTSAGFFGMNWFAADTTEDAAKIKKKDEARLSRAEVYKLIELISEPSEDGDKKPTTGNEALLPSGDYAGLFVEEVSVAVRSTPTGARVWRGDEMIGVTPLVLRLAKDPATTLILRVEKEGYQPRSLSFDQGDSREFDVALFTTSAAPKRRPAGKKPRKKKTPAKPKKGGSKMPTADDFIIY